MAVPRRREVVWARPAVADLDALVDYIGRERPRTAESVLVRIRKAADKLDQLPERGRVVPELQRTGITLFRELIVKPWRIVYRPAGRKVFVLMVIDSRRNMEDVLLERLVRGR